MKRIAVPIVLAGIAAVPSTAAGDPIPETDDSAPQFIGAPATQSPVFVSQASRHPFMAPNERSNLHNDAWQTDTNVLPGPLGKDMTRTSAFHSADCASVTFDSRGRIVTVCVGLNGPRLYMKDAQTLEDIATFDLPPRQPGANNPTTLFTDFAGGGYFYLDNEDRAVMPTTTRHLYVVGQTADGSGFELQHDYDLTGAVPQGDKIISALPDWSGRYWFASIKGVVGTVAPSSGAIRSIDTGEPNGNSFAVDETGGVYIVTDGALYRFVAGPDGTPQRTWRTVYQNDGQQKSGQTQKGSGTTPTITSAGFVAITDNDDPIHIAVYRRSDGGLVCRAPVFERGASSTDQSLIGAGRSFVTENNFGYTGPTATEQGRTTTPGLERVDVDDRGNCNKVWRSEEIAPSVVPKLSLANGLVYTYTKPGGDDTDPWYLTALDFATGRTVYKYRAGSGLGFNNNYAPVTIGPDGTAYVGVLGGLVAMRDATPPPQVDQTPGRARPRLGLRLRYGSRRRCSRRRVRARVVGPDAALVRLVDFRVGRRHRSRDRRPPFTRLLRVGSGRIHPKGVHARVRLADGRRTRLHRRVRPCARVVSR
jgi:hypothetical protein